MIKPIQGNILIEPIIQETAWSTSQTSYEERGKVLAISDLQTQYASSKDLYEDADKKTKVQIGDYIYFDSWQAARFKDGEGKEIWLVHIDAVRAVENQDEPPLSE